MWTDDSFRIDDRTLSDFCDRPVQTPPVWKKKSLQASSHGTYCMRERIWKGDAPVADVEELDNLDASEIHARRLNAPETGEEFVLPFAIWSVKFAGRSGFSGHPL